MACRIVLFGASGYTGRLVAEALVRAKVRPVLAGRSHQNLAALGVALGKGLDIAVADVGRPESLLAILHPHDVLVSTVGPFVRYGRPVVEAAIIRQCTYIDSTGEPGFIRGVIDELGPIAAQAGVTLIPSAAFDYAAGELAAELALKKEGAAAAVRVDVAYFITGKRALSGGTVASAGSSALEAQPAFRDGQIVASRVGERIATMEVGGKRRTAISIGAAEHFWLPRRHPALREVNVFLGSPGGGRTAKLAGRLIAAGSTVPGMPRVVGAVARRPRASAGPTPEQRRLGGVEVQAAALAEDGAELSRSVLQGVNPYDFSGEFLAWEAMRLAAMDSAPAGAQSPMDVFGLDAVAEAAAAAGLREATPTRT